jgi:hypothetical protein
MPLFDYFGERSLNHDYKVKRLRIDQWKPGSDFETILFYPGNYKILTRTKTGSRKYIEAPFYAFYRSYIPPQYCKKPKGVYVTCRCNAGALKQDCALCEMYHKAITENNKILQGVYRPKEFYAYNIYRLSFFHKTTERIERRDEVISRQVIKRCLASESPEPNKKICPYCKHDDERFFGKRGFLIVGKAHNDIILDIDLAFASKCKCGGNIIITKVMCRNCGSPFITDDEALTDKTLIREDQMCYNCGTFAIPIYETVCDKCNDPHPLGIYDIPVSLKSVGGNNTRTLLYNMPNETAVKTLTSLINKEELAPYDFPSLFVTTYEEQEELLGVSSILNTETDIIDDSIEKEEEI